MKKKKKPDFVQALLFKKRVWSLLLVTPKGKYNDSFQTGEQFRLCFRGTVDLVVAQQHRCTAEQVALTLIYYSLLLKMHCWNKHWNRYWLRTGSWFPALLMCYIKSNLSGEEKTKTRVEFLWKSSPQPTFKHAATNHETNDVWRPWHLCASLCFSQLFPDVFLLAVEPEGQAELRDFALRAGKGPGRSSEPRPGGDTLCQYGGDLWRAGGCGGPWPHNGRPLCFRGPEGFGLCGHRRSPPPQPVCDLPPTWEPAPAQRRLYGESEPHGLRTRPATAALVLFHSSAALWESVLRGKRRKDESALAGLMLSWLRAFQTAELLLLPHHFAQTLHTLHMPDIQRLKTFFNALQAFFFFLCIPNCSFCSV